MSRELAGAVLKTAVDPVRVAETALGRPVARATLTGCTSVAYDPYLAGRVVERASGVAETTEGEVLTWTAVVKRTDGVGLRAARRELAAYRDGMAASSPPTGLRAPALLAWADAGEHVELWLEVLTDEHGGHWPPSRFAVAARHIAAWDARAGRTPLPPDFDSEDAWAERHGQPHRVPEARGELDGLRSVARATELMDHLDDRDFRRTAALIASTVARVERLAAFPVTPLHHDLVRSNLFALGDASTAAIDWENVGRGPLGVDLAPLVLGSVRRGEASADDLRAIESAILDAYVDGLREAGIDAEEQVRVAYRLAVGLRWHVVLGTIREWLMPSSTRIRGSLPGESRTEALRHLVALSRHILDVGVGSSD